MDESRFSLYRVDADNVYGIVWVSGLLTSTLWIKWPMVAVELWYGYAYVMYNRHWCILLMAFRMHRDTVMRSWGPLLCHSSTTITSCLQHDNPRPHVARISTQFLEAENIPVLAWPAYSADMSHIEHIWDALDWRILKRSGSTFHNQQPDQLYAKEMCCTAWGKWWSHQILTGFWQVQQATTTYPSDCSRTHAREMRKRRSRIS